jgi:transposase
MPKRLFLQPHLNLEQLSAHYRKAKDPVERSHWQIIWLLARGKTTQEVAATTGYSLEWIRQVARRYNELGPAGLGDRRHRNPGGDRLLSAQQVTELAAALQGPAPDGGPWNSRKVAEWIAQKTGRTIHVQRGWEYLRRLGLDPHQHRHQHRRTHTLPEVKVALREDFRQWRVQPRKTVLK